VCVQETGEIWTWANPKIRVENNQTFDRVSGSSGS